MAALVNANPMPSGRDDLADSTVTAGNTVSGWNNADGYTFRAHDTFPISADGAVLDEDDDGLPGTGPRGSWGTLG